jgi:pyrroloquinoline quinone biosynthesis protein B
MHIKILGSAADGGFPQWNCSCLNCSGLRNGSLRTRPRSQTQIALSPLPNLWFLVGASPDLRSQLLAAPGLSPSPEAPGRTPIAGVFLPSAEIDAVMGLLHLREFQNFFIFATPAIQRLLKTENRMFQVLERSDPPVQWQALSAGRRVGCHLSDNPGDAPTFFYSVISLPGPYPDYVSDDFLRAAPPDESTVGFLFEQNNKKIFIAPRLPGRTAEWIKPAASADTVLIDGAFWSDDELLATGRTTKTARDLGHLPLSGSHGLLAQFPADAVGRKILINMNNTNPLLDDTSSEHCAVLDAGFEIAYDGMEISV